jgi:hypothetical protein
MEAQAANGREALLSKHPLIVASSPLDRRLCSRTVNIFLKKFGRSNQSKP